MSNRREGAALVGVGAAACAVCCAGPILGFLVAIGLGTAVGFAVFGSIALLIGAVAAIILTLRRNRQTQPSCDAPTEQAVELMQRP